jgi:hypothetical protein
MNGNWMLGMDQEGLGHCAKHLPRTFEKVVLVLPFWCSQANIDSRLPAMLINFCRCELTARICTHSCTI